MSPNTQDLEQHTAALSTNKLGKSGCGLLLIPPFSLSALSLFLSLLSSLSLSHSFLLYSLSHSEHMLASKERGEKNIRSISRYISQGVQGLDLSLTQDESPLFFLPLVVIRFSGYRLNTS